jgi:hypothetical protein
VDPLLGLGNEAFSDSAGECHPVVILNIVLDGGSSIMPRAAFSI